MVNVRSNDKEYVNGENNVNIIDGEYKVSGFGTRHKQCLIMFFYLATAYSMRANIGVALVGMIDDTPRKELVAINEYINDTLNANETVIEDARLVNVTNTSNSYNPGNILQALLLTPPYPKFNWSKKVQDIVISSFFWGYMTLQIPAGQLVHRLGPRRLLVGSLAINATVSFIFPWAAYYGGWILAAVCRLLQGLSQACVVPGMYGFFGQWTVLEERSRLVGFSMGGQAIGTVLGLPVTGFLAASPLGWPGIFRFYGLLSGLVTLAVFFTVTDTPAEHPKISAAERRFIEEGLGIKHGEKKKTLKVPWRHILGSRAIYIILIAHISQTWGQVTLFTEIPAFMAKVMKVNIKSNGLLTALPFFVMWFTNFFFMWFTDMIIVKKWVSVTNARKIANSIGCVPASIGFVVLAFAPKNIYVVESLLVAICAFKIATHVGSMVSHIDITPNFASTMMSISNFCSNLVGSMAPVVTGFLLNDVTSEYEWRKVFLLTAGFYFFTNVIYVMFGTAEKAPWNDPEYEDEENKPETELMIKNQEKKNSLKT